MGAVVIGNISDEFSIGRPAGAALISLFLCDWLWFASFKRNNPVIDPVATVGAKEKRFAIRRNNSVTESPAFPVVEKVFIRKNQTRIPSR